MSWTVHADQNHLRVGVVVIEVVMLMGVQSHAGNILQTVIMNKAVHSFVSFCMQTTCYNYTVSLGYLEVTYNIQLLLLLTSFLTSTTFLTVHDPCSLA